MNKEEFEQEFKNEYLGEVRNTLERAKAEKARLKEQEAPEYLVNEQDIIISKQSARLDEAERFFREDHEFDIQQAKKRENGVSLDSVYETSFTDRYKANIQNEINGAEYALRFIEKNDLGLSWFNYKDKKEEIKNKLKVLKSRMDTVNDIEQKWIGFVTEHSIGGKLKAKFVNFSEKVTGRKLTPRMQELLAQRKTLTKDVLELHSQIRVLKDMLKSNYPSREIKFLSGKEEHMYDLLREIDKIDKGLMNEYAPTKGQQKTIKKEIISQNRPLSDNGVIYSARAEDAVTHSIQLHDDLMSWKHKVETSPMKLGRDNDTKDIPQDKSKPKPGHGD